MSAPLRGAVRRDRLVSDIPDDEITAPSPALIAAVKANDHAEIDRLTRTADEGREGAR